ncbi:4'-phosphopantetheinyl transferase family protein [Tianweitania populi]|uniref:4'-phosphopantetheinyl transferase family protein n=1 Tax=Tianweitania populi TaxID=1607949 RepID=UPI0036DB52A3
MSLVSKWTELRASDTFRCNKRCSKSYAMLHDLGPLDPNDVHCWFFDMDGFDVGRLRNLLAPDEQERAARFVFEQDRARYRIGRGLLRLLIGAYLGQAPGSLRFDYCPAGKPMLAHPLHFNLAHSHGAGLIAVTRAGQVGVDLERVRPIDDIDAVVANHFAEEERAEFAALHPDLQLRGFYAGWTRKEAILKVTGDGLATRSLQSFALQLAPEERNPLLLRYDDHPSPNALWTIVDISSSSELTAAVALSGNDLKIRVRDFSANLADTWLLNRDKIDLSVRPSLCART